MIRHGEPPYLECSSKGDKRFSAFYARLPDGRSIEEAYQAFKIFELNGSTITGLYWREAKGYHPINAEEAAKFYSECWNIYIANNPDLHQVLIEASGLSDIFGQEGHCCQATELWRIRQELIDNNKNEK